MSDSPTIPREELKEKLEDRISRAEYRRNKAMLLAAESRAKGDSLNSNLCDLSAEFNADEIAILRTCLTELERGERDEKILDAIDKHMMSLSHTRATHSVMMCGTTIHGQFENLDRTNGGGSFRKVKGRNIREAVLSAITTSNQQEGK